MTRTPVHNVRHSEKNVAKDCQNGLNLTFRKHDGAKYKQSEPRTSEGDCKYRAMERSTARKGNHRRGRREGNNPMMEALWYREKDGERGRSGKDERERQAMHHACCGSCQRYSVKPINRFGLQRQTYR